MPPRPGISPVDDLIRELAAAPARRPPVPLVGSVLAHRYEVMREVSKGGMGRLLAGWDRRRGRRVALKLIREELADTPLVMEQFLEEARVTAGLNHPNIVELVGYGEHRGRPYLVQEHLFGGSLAVHQTPRPRGSGEALDLIIPVVRALAHCHEHVPPVLHRGLRPDNVFLCEDGRLMVLDLGLAVFFRARWPDGVPRGGWRATSLAGSYSYMAPEQLRGGEQDARVDVWAMGIMLFELLAGLRPYQQMEMNRETLLDAVLSQRAVVGLRQRAPGSIPQLALVVDRCLAKRREERYQTAGDLLEDLERTRRHAVHR